MLFGYDFVCYQESDKKYVSPTQNVAALAQKKRDAEAEQKKCHGQVQELSRAKEQLLGQVRSLETQTSTLNNIIQQSKSQEEQLRKHLDLLMVKASP